MMQNATHRAGKADRLNHMANIINNLNVCIDSDSGCPVIRTDLNQDELLAACAGTLQWIMKKMVTRE
jgi:hypothetical protein